MTELYRGLLLVLTVKFIDLITTVRDLIRDFKQQTSDDTNYLDVGVMGFWNLMLEVVFTMYGVICLTVGIVLTAGLAVMFYPLAAVLNACSLMLINTRQAPTIPYTGSDGIDSVPEHAPIIMRKGKEKNGL